MQKKIIALALAGLASSAAFAQSNVTVYGRMDYGFMSRSGDINNTVVGTTGNNVYDRKNEFESGVASGSRLGFKGSEDLGNGLKAIFQAEYQVGNANKQGSQNLAVARNQWVGLTGGFGTVVGGYLDGVRYGIYNKYDAFAGGTVANFTQMTGQVDRAENAIAYISPTWNGLTATLAYSTAIGSANTLNNTTTRLGAMDTAFAGLNNFEKFTTSNNEGAGNRGDGRLYTAMVNYTNGPLDLTADYERIKFKASGNTAAQITAALAGTGTGINDLLDGIKVVTLAGSYDFGVVKVRALWDNLKSDYSSALGGGRANNVDSWFVSATAPVTAKLTLKATYGATKDKQLDEDLGINTKAKKLGLGAQYDLSKRTNLYANYGRITGENDMAIAISQLGNGYLSSTAYGKQGIDMGIAHNF